MSITIANMVRLVRILDIITNIIIHFHLKVFPVIHLTIPPHKRNKATFLVFQQSSFIKIKNFLVPFSNKDEN